MNINNPGVLDGSITTAKLANGAVTTAKVNTSDFSPLITSTLNVEGNVGSYADSYPGFEFLNAASNQHWIIDEATTDGTQQLLEVYDNVNSRSVLQCNTDGTVSLNSPLPVASGGLGAASFLAAGVPEVLDNSSVAFNGTAGSDITNYAVPAAGLYRVSIYGRIHVTSANNVTISPYIQFTDNTVNETLDSAETTTTNVDGVVSYVALIHCDAGSSIIPVMNASGGTTADTGEAYSIIERIA